MRLKDLGTNGDDQIGHLTTGEVVIPKGMLTPGVIDLLEKQFKKFGKNIGEFTVGPEAKENPFTGIMAFGDVDKGNVDSSMGGTADQTGEGDSSGGYFGGDMGNDRSMQDESVRDLADTIGIGYSEAKELTNDIAAQAQAQAEANVSAENTIAEMAGLLGAHFAPRAEVGVSGLPSVDSLRDLTNDVTLGLDPMMTGLSDPRSRAMGKPDVGFFDLVGALADEDYHVDTDELGSFAVNALGSLVETAIATAIPGITDVEFTGQSFLGNDVPRGISLGFDVGPVGAAIGGLNRLSDLAFDKPAIPSFQINEENIGFGPSLIGDLVGSLTDLSDGGFSTEGVSDAMGALGLGFGGETSQAPNGMGGDDHGLNFDVPSIFLPGLSETLGAIDMSGGSEGGDGAQVPVGDAVIPTIFQFPNIKNYGIMGLGNEDELQLYPNRKFVKAR